MSIGYNENDPGAAKWLRGYGNAIVQILAAVFVRAFLEGEHDPR